MKSVKNLHVKTDPRTVVAGGTPPHTTYQAAQSLALNSDQKAEQTSADQKLCLSSRAFISSHNACTTQFQGVSFRLLDYITSNLFLSPACISPTKMEQVLEYLFHPDLIWDVSSLAALRPL